MNIIKNIKTIGKAIKINMLLVTVVLIGWLCYSKLQHKKFWDNQAVIPGRVLNDEVAKLSQIGIGMSYEEVVEILGPPAEVWCRKHWDGFGQHRIQYRYLIAGGSMIIQDGCFAVHMNKDGFVVLFSGFDFQEAEIVNDGERVLYKMPAKFYQKE